MTARRLAPVLLTAALLGVAPATIAGAGSPVATASAATTTPPAVTLAVSPTPYDTCGENCLPANSIVMQSGSTAPVAVTAALADGVSVRSIALQFAAVGSTAWRSLRVTFPSSPPYTGQLQDSYFPNFPPANGTYDLRAAVTDSTGQVEYSQLVPIVVVAPGATYLGLQNPGTALSGTVTLTAAPQRDAPYTPTQAQFQVSPAGANQWTPIGSAVTPTVNGAGKQVLDGSDEPEYSVSLDTTKLANGSYDLEAVGSDSTPGDSYDNNPITVLVDNTAPTVTLTPPASPLAGVVELSATAGAAASGIASVRFQVAPSGSNDWTTVGLSTSSPYQADFDTRAFENGSYDVQAVVTSGAGLTADSIVPGVTIDNPGGQINAGNFNVTDTVVPATGAGLQPTMTLLGEVSGADHEAWAYGYTTGAPAAVNGAQLPYTASPGSPQLVLLRYTDQSGWQVSDVLRNADGTGFPVSSDAVISGAMASNGDAWLMVFQNGTTSIFHRAPGGQFLLDQAATDSLDPLLGSISSANPPEFELDVDPTTGATYGLLVNPGQASESDTVNSSGNSVDINTALSYAELTDGTWSIQSVPVPTSEPLIEGEYLSLGGVSPSGPSTGWAAVNLAVPGNATPAPLILGSYTASGWDFVPSTGLDALDLTGSFALGPPLTVGTTGILAASDGVWIEAQVGGFNDAKTREVVALYDPTAGRVTESWCSVALVSQSVGCENVLDASDPASLPDAVFDTAKGPVALALGQGDVDVYAGGTWSSEAAPGFDGGQSGAAIFADPSDGWLAGTNALGQIAPAAPAASLQQWPEANQATLLGVALPPGGAGIGTSGALAVGLRGAALHYDSSAGWLVDPVPAQARSANLLSVAYNGPSSAVAVGSFGTILDWNGSSWSMDPQSQSLTDSQLNSVAFESDGEGWAVGTNGTILHYDNGQWSTEQADAADSGGDITSVAVAGDQVFAVADGYLIERQSDGSWERVDPNTLPADLQPGTLTLVSGLPDGGLVAAGTSDVIVRQSADSPFTDAPAPIEGTAVGLDAFRDPSSGQVRAFVSVAPSADFANSNGANLGSFPPGDGELLLETDSGWQDLSRAQNPYAGQPGSGPGDGQPEPDPVLAVASSADGSSAWAVGGYAGSITAAGVGLNEPLVQRPTSWQTSSVWRYDAGGSIAAPSLSQATVTIPAQPNTVSFAFFSGSECVWQCSEVQDAQPMVNLGAAAGEIATFAQQPGGPAFALLGGNAVGPSNQAAQNDGNGAADLANLPHVLAPLGTLPLYAAYGPLDSVPTSSDPAQPWGDAFAQSPAPFGLGPAPSGIEPVSSGGRDGSVNHYYAFDVQQNGATLRVIVLDNSAGSLDASAAGQSAWLQSQLAAAQTAGHPVVVFAAEPLDDQLLGAASDGSAVATELADAGVLAVFTGSPSESDQEHMIPAETSATTTQAQIPEYEGATLGYQQTQNNGVLWYFVSVDTANDTVSVEGIPVVQSLALEPLDGLTVARSSTLSFQAVGRRPPGTITSGNGAQGFANYVSIPAPSCTGCVKPSYTFTSSNPAIGNFVTPSGSGSQFPKLTASGKTIASSTSGLFCAFNAGTTTVSVTSGVLTSSSTVTVQPGAIGQPCGTVAYAPADNVEVIPGKTVVSSQTAGNANPADAAAPPPVVQSLKPVLPHLSQPPPPPPAVVPAPAAPVVHAPVPTPAPTPVATPALAAPFIAAASPFTAATPVLTPPIPPPITPVPPGGATAPAQSTAKREERARKHASQSAYVTRPAGTPAEDWFYPVAGAVTIVAVMLIGGGLRPSPRQRPVLLQIRDTDERPRRRRK